MDRRCFHRLLALAGATALTRCAPPHRPAQERDPFPFLEATIADLQAAMKAGHTTAAQLSAAYLDRIAAIDQRGPTLRSVIEINPDALSIAEELDRERGAQRSRGPLHGIPILLKDNIATADRMQTTAGSLMLEGIKATQDAHIVKRLRASGAVILGKTNLSEWANIRSTRSTSGWSARGGLTRNPYALDRNTSGSSSGSAAAVAANLCAAAIGTETDGSIVSPASINGVVGLKPTVGLVSRHGIIPISHTQDTAGPITRTVADAAIVLAVLSGADKDDAATAMAHPESYATAIASERLRGARLGVVRGAFGPNDEVSAVIDRALSVMQTYGAVLVDPVVLPQPPVLEQAELEVLLTELKYDLTRYLSELAPNAPAHTLAELIAWNRRNREREMPWFGQELFEQAEAKGGLDSPAYQDALATCRRLARTEGIDAVLAEHHLDALVAPTGGPAWLSDFINGDHVGGSFSTPAAIAGYPHLTIPAGLLRGLPIGLSLVGPAQSEARLLAMGYAFERATKARRPPSFASTLAL